MNYSPGLNATSSGSSSVLVLSSLIPVAFDYISANYAGATSDVYTYKSGGSGGTTVATVTVVWTDATKAVLSTVTRT